MSPAIPRPEPALRGDLFVLREFRSDDFEAARLVAREPAESRWVEQLPEPDGERMSLATERHRLDGDVLHLVIGDPGDDRYLGEISLVMLEPGMAELGCAVIPEMRGRGIASQALALLSDWALREIGLRRVQVAIDPRNPAALKIAHNAGYQREGLLRSYWEVDGERMDAVLLSRLPQDMRE
jgi:[ribosomal protein S5]-alanine N-acetyltransferase